MDGWMDGLTNGWMDRWMNDSSLAEVIFLSVQ